MAEHWNCLLPYAVPPKISNPEAFLLSANNNAYVAKQNKVGKKLDISQNLAQTF